MPELPEVEAVRRELAPVLLGVRIVSVVLNRAGLRRPFPVDFVERVSHQTVRALDRRGKYLLARLASGDTLLMHLGMSGAFRVERGDDDAGAADRHDHVVFGLGSGARVVFNDPRRFGVMDVIAQGEEDRVLDLGPEPLDDAAFDGAVLARACARSRAPLKAVLLDQRVVAGVGNIYAAEALHVARLSPRRQASTLAATRGGSSSQPGRADALASAIKTVLRQAIARHERPYRTSRFRVYDRAGSACPRRGCEGTIRRIIQGGRSTFYCPSCQR